jgi:type I pantothenate kinase
LSHPSYLDFSGNEWSALRANTPLTLTQRDIEKLRGINVNLDIDMVEESFLPLSRLLDLRVQGGKQLSAVTDTFLGTPLRRIPFVLGVAGSVAVGKSTISRVLQQLLAQWPQHPRVELVTTDGFLLPNEVLQDRNLMDRKGFPESYDRRALLDFIDKAKSGTGQLEVPIYSHFAYDVLPDEVRTIASPDILIVEGLNVLQTGDGGVFVSDYFDFSIFVDAELDSIREWYIERFLTLRDTAFAQPDDYFHRYAGLSDQEATEVAEDIWARINEVNLMENILPTRSRASLILEKAKDHSIERVRLRH